MRPTLLLLSLVAIALMSGTEAQPIWNGEQAFDEMDDDGCSTRNFDRVLVATVEITGRAPNPACARAVFDKICDQCEDNIRCYLELGRQVGPMTRQCQPRRLRVSVPDYTGPPRLRSTRQCKKYCIHHSRLDEAYCNHHCMGVLRGPQFWKKWTRRKVTSIEDPDLAVNSAEEEWILILISLKSHRKVIKILYYKILITFLWLDEDEDDYDEAIGWGSYFSGNTPHRINSI